MTNLSPIKGATSADGPTGPSPSKMGERRSGSRKASRQRGGIVASNGVDLGCGVLDLSETGARLEIPASVPFPIAFALRVGFSQPRPAKLVWRRGNQAGVDFDGDQEAQYVETANWF